MFVVLAFRRGLQWPVMVFTRFCQCGVPDSFQLSPLSTNVV